MNGPQLGSGISGRMLTQALYLAVASFWVIIVSGAPGMRWAVDVVPWMWGAAVVSLGVAAGFALHDSRDPELQEERFRTEVINRFLTERARIRARDARTSMLSAPLRMASIGEMRHAALSLPGVVAWEHRYYYDGDGVGLYFITVRHQSGATWGLTTRDDPQSLANAGATIEALMAIRTAQDALIMSRELSWDRELRAMGIGTGDSCPEHHGGY